MLAFLLLATRLAAGKARLLLRIAHVQCTLCTSLHVRWLAAMKHRVRGSWPIEVEVTDSRYDEQDKAVCPTPSGFMCIWVLYDWIEGSCT